MIRTEGKSWYESKAIWLNAIAIVVLIAQIEWGLIIPMEVQAIILAGINFVLRLITGKPIEWLRKVR